MMLTCATCKKSFMQCTCNVSRGWGESQVCFKCLKNPCSCEIDEIYNKYMRPYQGDLPKKHEDPSIGVKHDAGKNRIDLIPPELIFALGDILSSGAEKYSEHNWAKGMKYSRVFSAAMRHLWQWWWTGEPDKESGKSHLWHAAACIAFLIAYEVRKVGEDDRQLQKPTERPFR